MTKSVHSKPKITSPTETENLNTTRDRCSTCYIAYRSTRTKRRARRLVILTWMDIMHFVRQSTVKRHADIPPVPSKFSATSVSVRLACASTSKEEDTGAEEANGASVSHSLHLTLKTIKTPRAGLYNCLVKLACCSLVVIARKLIFLSDLKSSPLHRLHPS